MGVRARIRPYVWPVERHLFIRAQRRLPGRPVVLLTLGKTASSTVRSTLWEHVPGRPVLQVHTIAESSLRAGDREYRRVSPRVRPGHVWRGLGLRSRMPSRETPWDVVTLVRDPVARAVSAWFQSGQRVGRDLEQPDPGEMAEWLRDRQPDPWFDTQIRDELGVDVFAHDFDHQAGYRRIDTPAVRLLVIRQENLDGAGLLALSDFVAAPLSGWASTNVGADKRYAEDYARFRRTASFPDDVLDEMYDSRYARHFYSEQERQAQRKAWAAAT